MLENTETDISGSTVAIVHPHLRVVCLRVKAQIAFPIQASSVILQ
uniref:Uncharacterized protein n=1 Tax=Anguilla anguilla TaxID=7936 RepID=A0A0E9TQ38_ANGAN